MDRQPFVMTEYCCAHCLIAINSSTRLVCGSCRRRTFCSRKCQVADWKSTGQGHKMWCKYNCGEEEIDWRVKYISKEKGKGLVALRDIPEGFKVMVDKRVKLGNEQQHFMLDLEPLGGSPLEKFTLNSMKDYDGTAVLCPRMARANHDCWPNSLFYVISVGLVKSMALTAVRDIAAGEEITVCYTDWNSGMVNGSSIEQHHSRLTDVWGIICPSSCPCHSEPIQRSLQKARELDRLLMAYCAQKDAFTSLSIARTLLSVLDMVGYPLPATKCHVCHKAFEATMGEPKYQEEGLRLLRIKYDIVCAMECEDSDEAVKCKQWLEQSQAHPEVIRVRKQN